MELRDLKLTLSIFKRFGKSTREKYYRNYENAKYQNECAKDFTDGFYNFLVQHGVSQELVKKFRKNYVEDSLQDEIKPYNDYLCSFLLATQIDECEICFARMKKIGNEERTYVSCWIERKNLVFDMTTGSVYNNDDKKESFYKTFGISKSEIVRINNKKLKNDEQTAKEVITKLCEADEENRRIYQKALKQIKIKTNGEGK